MFERSTSRRLSVTGMLLGCLLTGIVALASDEPPVGKTPGSEDSQTLRRWAIISGDPKSAALADLLTVELSHWKQVALVERQQITKVLNELELNASGLVAPDQAVRFGQLSRADALLLLAARDEPRSPSVRVQLVEASTSVRLLDLLIPSANFQRELEAILSELRRAESKLAIPEDRRRFIGVLAIHSGEPGGGLKAQCRTLQALVEIRLQQHPQFVVLEREQLQRLTAESNLTGAELKIRSAAWLVEAGVRRRNGGQGFAIT